MDNRVVFSEDPGVFFASVKSNLKASSWKETAFILHVNVRTLTSWRSRDTAMPASIAQDLSKRLGLNLPKHNIFDFNEGRRLAGSTGGSKRNELYGNPGTPKGRSRGGINAVATHRRKDISPFVAKEVSRPKPSAALAELAGAILGDGTITHYQMVLYSNLANESAYSDYLRQLILDTFHFEPTSVRDKKHGVIRLICSRKNFIAHLEALGLMRGNKTTRQAAVPKWIERKPAYARACVRGLIDTDGCVYLDRHIVKARPYAFVCIAFTNASMPLLDFVERTLIKEGYTPTRWGRNIRLRRRNEVLRYAKEIGFSNPKHALKIRL